MAPTVTIHMWIFRCWRAQGSIPCASLVHKYFCCKQVMRSSFFSPGLHHLWNEIEIRCISGSKGQNHPEITNRPDVKKQTFSRTRQAKALHKGILFLGGCPDLWQLTCLNCQLSLPVCSLKTSEGLVIPPSPEQEKAEIANIFMGWERCFPLNSTQMCSRLCCGADEGSAKPLGRFPLVVNGFVLPKMWHHF